MRMIKQTREEYFRSFPPSTRKLLDQMRDTVRKAAPGATEDMKYGLPTLVLNGKNLLHYGAYAHHVGFYPTPSVLLAFEKEISGYKHSKGAVQFSLDQPLPLGLVSRMARFRVKEHMKKSGAA
jgi:uncharacterized protein YdhG (YjbR/CyaY superfamily)